MATHSAWADWTLDDRGEPGLALRECLLAATAAPSIHNTQPWRFRPQADGVDVLADLDRRLDVIDPRGREVLLSVGAALLNLRIAIGAHGRTPLTSVTPPDRTRSGRAGDDGPAARPSATVRMLAAAIPRRHTNRRPFSAATVPASAGANCRRPPRPREAACGRRTRPPGTVSAWSASPRPAAARRALPPGTGRVDGHRPPGARSAPGVVRTTSAMQAVPLRDFGRMPARHRHRSLRTRTHHRGALLHGGDAGGPGCRSGQALERTLLTATVRGLATTLMTQPSRSAAASLLVDRAPRRPQAIVRFGYGPPCPPTPRRGSTRSSSSRHASRSARDT